MIKIITKAKYIPDKAVVTKPTGSKEYTLIKNNLILYGEDKISIKIEKDCYYLQSMDSINIISDKTELAIHFELEDEAEMHSFIDILCN